MRSYNIEKDWTTGAGLRAVIVRLVSDYSRVGGHRCAYVGIPQGHPLHGVGYSDNTEALAKPADDTAIGKRGVLSLICASERMQSPEVVFDVHGSLTFAKSGAYPVESDLWWFGFDCAHCDDDEDGGRSLEYVTNECESLAKQIVEKTVTESAGRPA